MREKLAHQSSAEKHFQFTAYRLVSLQLITLIVVALVWSFVSLNAAVSVLLGGAAAILPNFYFARRFFARIHTKDAKRLILTFYFGEFLKLLFSVALLLVMFYELKAMIMPLFTGFLGAYLGLWLAPLLTVTKKKVTGR